MSEWESVSAPRGEFIGWGKTPGQHVTGKVLNYGVTAGSDIDNNPCPEVTVELTEQAASFRKGERKDIPAGEVVKVTCSVTQLRRDIPAANLSPGDLVKITLERLEPSPKGSDAKIFDVKVRRNSDPVRPAYTGATVVPQQTQVAFGDDAAPPF